MDDLDNVDKIVVKLLMLGVSEAAVEPVRNWVRDRRAGKPEKVFYFGTWSQAGHYWWEPGRSGPVRPRNGRSSLEPIGPWGHVDGRLTPREVHVQSAAAIHHMDGWTAVAMHDYTVDTRGGSNAVFIMDSEVSFAQAMAYAVEFFPEVVARINSLRPIKLEETCLDCKGGKAHDRR